MIKSSVRKLYIALIFIFLYAPIVTLMVLSFNASRSRAKWGGFTLKWYRELFQNEVILAALSNTLLIALLSSLIATLIGTIACISMQAMKRRTRAVMMGVTNIPMPRFKQLNPSTYEAALDLGASPLRAFFMVVFPDILPGVVSGFLMAFTMSLDDFIITHFTKGPGIDTLSTKIYSEVKKGIKPEMYALSAIIFTAVLVLLFLVNYIPKENKEKKEK